MPADRKWSIEQEINLFSLVCDFKPAGEERDKNLTQILIRINENIDNDERFTAEQVWSKLRDFFELEKTEDIEREHEEKEATPSRDKTPEKEIQPLRTSARAKSRELSTRESTIETSPAPPLKTEETATEKNDEPELYSSELSDIEGEETELEKLHDREPSPPPTRDNKRRGRPKKGGINSPVKEETPAKEIPAVTPRKRTRSIAKEEDEDSTPKKRPSATPNTRRKTRSEATPDSESNSTTAPSAQTQKHENVENAENAENAETSAEPDKESKNKPMESTQETNDNSEEAAEKTTAADESNSTENAKIEDSAKATESEEPKTRRSKRQAVRRSTRNK